MKTVVAFARNGLVLLGLVFWLAGCAAAPQASLAERVAQVDEARLRADVDALARIGSSVERRREADGRLRLSLANPQAQAQKLAYLRAQLEPHGYVIELETFDLPTRFGLGPDVKGINLLATRRGRAQPEQIIELGAHYDTMATAGADDNSSGVAGVLEIARVLADVPLAKTVRFCFYDVEELGLLGSREHVRRIKQRGEQVAGAIVFEMIGYAVDGANTQRTPVRIPFVVDPPKVGNFIAVVGDVQSSALGREFEQAIEKYVPGLPYFSMNRLGGMLRDAARSDHYSYWVEGIPGVMITDTANFRNPHYHRKTDTPDTLNFVFMAKVTRAGAAWLLTRAQAPDR